jgi:molybdenum cofactor biosynthesis enzyme MoaA
MEWDLFRKIVDECLHSGIERISPYLMNEPLLDRGLPQKIRYVSDNKNERSYTKVNTNASLLTEEMGRELIQAKLDRLNVSFHGIRRTTYEASMVGLNYEDVLQKVNSFIETKQRLNAEKPRLRITMVRTKIIDGEIDEILAYWGKRGIKVNIRGLENRTNAEISSQGMFVEKWMPFRWCNRMMEQAYVLFNGDVILCCVDWERTTVLGNLRRNSLAEIWNGAAYTEVRRRFLAGDLKDMLCRKCLKEPDYT